ncbi:MAG: S8 family serine peptidase [Roseivirga sp.]|nr:S8 family serine peptidase [Roseivirga sp.]
MIRKNTLHFLCVLLILMVSLSANGQEISEGKWEGFVLKELPLKSRNQAKKNEYYLIRDLETEGFSQLRARGLSLVRKLDASTAIVRFPENLEAIIPNTDFSFWEVNSDWKLSANLLAKGFSSESENYLIKSYDMAGLRLRLEELGIAFKQLGTELIRINVVDQLMMGELLERSDVYYIGKESLDVKTESRVLDMNLNPNAVNRVHHDFPELDGRGMVLSIREGMFDVMDMDLRARHLFSPLEGDEPTNHATEMATIAAGAGNSSLNGRGVAGAVTITGSLLDELIPDANEDYLNLNAWVQNHSYGTSEIENFYGAFAEAYDLSANANPNLLHVFSAGNLGASTPETGTYMGNQPVANMTGNFKMSKNTLAVASVDTVGREVAFVSRGPAHDGRIKPELVTYSVAGSSNSAALVSGISVLIQQAYLNLQGSLPASALVKSLLINSASDVGNKGPDYVTGYGNVNAYRAIENLKANRFFTGTLTNGENQTFNLDIPANAINLKVTLVWNDPAANANANIALVNDLDLKIRDAANQEFLPWILDSRPERLGEIARRGVDRLNNVEQIGVANPTAGRFTIQVDAFDLPEGAQEFYVAWQLDEANTFDWSFPSGSDNMPYNGETTSYFRWESTLDESTGQLEYSIDNGMSWELIAANVDLSKGYYRWDAPQLRSGAIARMVVGTQFFNTDIFTISRPERIRVGFSCADSVRLQWNSLPEATAYEVSTFGDALLEPIALVSDTSYTFNKSTHGTKLFAIRPVLADGANHVRAATFDYDLQGVGCYLVSFFSQAQGEEGVLVNVDLGTIAGVDEITIERQIRKSGFEEIATLRAGVLPLGTNFLDRSPDQGLNEYRATIHFENGQQISTEVSSTYFLTTEPFLVFPNPVPRGDRLNVFSKVFMDNPEVSFALYNHAGLPLFTQRLNSERVSFGLERLQAGIYFYRITTDGYTHKGRVILE